jgi:hypothetical protein
MNMVTLSQMALKFSGTHNIIVQNFMLEISTCFGVVTLQLHKVRIEFYIKICVLSGICKEGTDQTGLAG